MRLTYHPEAEAELLEAARFYEQKIPGLGSRFLISIDRAAAAIREAPCRWNAVELDIRRYLLTKFPFAIYYSVLSDQIRILAIKHHSRHPDYWRGRGAG